MDFGKTIIIPTYNEKENLEFIVKELTRHLQGEDFEIVIVDDNSPDGTGRIAEELKGKLPLRVIHRPVRLGLSSAIVAGLKVAEGAIVGVMDADGSHPPNLAPKLLDNVKRGSDLAIASRYVPGGSVENWSFGRKIISKIAVILAKPLTKIKDPVSGYFFFKKNIIEDVSLEPRGYKILLEIIVRANIKKFVEVPYKFIDRQKGKSKFNSSIIRDYIYQVSQLYSLRFRRFMKFCMVGLSGVFVNMFFLWFFTEMAGLSYLVSSPIAVELAIINNFIWNNLWTFRESKNKSQILVKLGKFNIVSIGALLINISTLFMLTEFCQLHYLISNVGGILLATLWNYFINVSWTWRG